VNGHHVRRTARARLDPLKRPVAASPVRARRARADAEREDRDRVVAVRRGGTRSAAVVRRAARVGGARIPSWRGAIRSRSSRLRRIRSSTRRSSTSRRCAAPRASRRWRFTPTTRRAAASRRRRACASTTIAASFTAEAVITDRVRPGVVSAPSVWWGSWPPTARTRIRRRRRRSPTSVTARRSYDNLVEVARSRHPSVSRRRRPYLSMGACTRQVLLPARGEKVARSAG
jgi:hypothetical protein